jgi:hypothetical protein
MASDLTCFAGSGKGDAKLIRERKGSVNHPLAAHQRPTKAKSGRLSSRANQCVTFGRASVHSQNEVAGTRQRCCGPSHGRQCGEAAFLTLVIGRLP